MNALLVTSAAPAMSRSNTDEKRSPLGFGSLIAVARAQGHTVECMHNYLEPTDFIDRDGDLSQTGRACFHERGFAARRAGAAVVRSVHPSR